MERTRAYCERKGWILDDSLRPDRGISAFRGKNAAVGALGEFLRAIETGRVKPGDVLIVESVDRISRQGIDEGYETCRHILKRGVRIVTLSPEREYDAEALKRLTKGALELQIILERAAEESETKSDRIRAAWKRQRADASNGQGKAHFVPPAWLRLNDDKTEFLVIPEAAKAIRTIYELAGQGMGINRITARLNEGGVPPITAGLTKKGAPIKRCTGKVTDSWRHSYVAKLMAEKAVTGEYQPHVMRDGKRVPIGDPIPNYFPTIIPLQEWYAVRQAVKERGKTRGRQGQGVANLFTGLIRDARDGQNMNLVLANTVKGINNARRLVSYGSRNGERGSVRLSFPYDIVERAFLESVRELKASDILGGKPDGKTAEIAALTARLDELEGKIAKVQERALAEQGVDALLTLLEKLDGERKATLTALEAAKAEAAHQQPEEALGEVQTLVELLDKSQGEERSDLRLKIRARIKQLVAEMWMLVWDVTDTLRGADVQVVLHNGKVWAYLFCWSRVCSGPFEARGIVTGIGHVVGRPDRQAHLADKLLRNYSTDSWTRAFFERQHASLGPAIKELIAAEVPARKAIAAVEALEKRRAAQK
jgi:DNA invertase Pin-like site-specific DNA recombinase